MPRDVVVRGAKLYVVDVAAPNVRVLDESGKLLAAVGTRGRGPGEFRNLAGVAVSSSGEIFASDRELRRVTMFASAGGVRADFNTLLAPGAIEVDGRDRVHISFRHPTGNNDAAGAPTVGVFSKTGTQLFSYGSYEPKPHAMAAALNNEVRFAAGSDGSMWVLYRYRGLIQQTSARGEVLIRFTIPAAEGMPTTGPFIKELEHRQNTIAIVRVPRADDIALGPPGPYGRSVLITRLVKRRASDGKSYTASELLAYSARGKLLGSQALRRSVLGFAAQGNTLYALVRKPSPSPAIDVYRINPPKKRG